MIASMSIEGKHFYRFTYLKSEEWKTARMMALAKVGARCQICGKEDWHNDAHHRKYPDDIWDTGPHHLIVLCRECHNRVHKTFGESASKGKWHRKRIAITHQLLREELERNPAPLHCVICESEDNVEVVKTGPVRPISLCQDCLFIFRNIPKPAKCSFWKDWNRFKNEIIPVLLAARRLHIKSAYPYRKMFKKLRRDTKRFYE